MPDWESLLPVLTNIFICQFLLSVGLILVMYRYPILIYKAWQRFLIYKNGFRIGKTKISDNYHFEYVERGNKDEQKVSVLLIHGFTSSKDTWCVMGGHIPKRFHIVALDLPGHGGTTRKEKEDVSFLALARRVEQFVEAVGLNKKKYHTMGTSLGGLIAGIHAAMFPDNVISTTLVCPAGINGAKSEMFLTYEQDKKIKLLPENDDEFKEMLAMIVHKPIKFPSIIVTGVMQARKQAHSFYLKLLEEIVGEKDRYILERKLKDIKAKTLVVWGKNDKVLDVSCAEIIRQKLPNCQVEILEECGHSISLERPRKLASLVTKFIDESPLSTLPNI